MGATRPCDGVFGVATSPCVSCWGGMVERSKASARLALAVLFLSVLPPLRPGDPAAEDGFESWMVSTSGVAGALGSNSSDAHAPSLSSS